MIDQGALPETTLQISRRFRAPVERVFRAFTDPDELQRWYALADDWETPVVEIDLRVGGRFRIGLRPPGRDTFYETGEYREIVPNQRLVYTQVLHGAGEGVDHDGTLTTIEFIARGAETDVVITEGGFPSVTERDVHASGWPGFLDRLEAMLG